MTWVPGSDVAGREEHPVTHVAYEAWANCQAVDRGSVHLDALGPQLGYRPLALAE